MQRTVSVTEKEIASQVSENAYVLGVQSNGDGEAALYRMKLSDMRGKPGIPIADRDGGTNYLANIVLVNGKPSIQYEEM